MSVDNVAQLGRRRDFVSPRSLTYLCDNGLAHDMVDTLRWNGLQPHCPRCASEFTKKVNTNVFRQLYRCIDCGYMFNSLSGTIFHGSKLPVYRFFQYFLMLNALGDDLTIRDICFALDCSFKTASLWQKRGDDIRTPAQFALVDRGISGQLLAEPQPATPKECESFFSFCEMKGIVVEEPLFIDYLTIIARAQTGDLGDT
jgi:transposase-like protein